MLGKCRGKGNFVDIPVDRRVKQGWRGEEMVKMPPVDGGFAEVEENEKLLEKLEAEAEVNRIKSPRHPKQRDLNPLRANEERKRTRKRKNSKKYDGRAVSKNAVVALPRVRAVLKDFYSSVKLPELKQALQLSNDPRYLTLLAMLNNPRFASFSFPELCRRSKMSLQDVVEVWRIHIRNQGIVKMMGHLPEIMEDVAIDSKSRIVLCNRCQGEGKLYGETLNRMEDPICPDCHGDGKVRLLGDKDARNLTFETVGLKKTGGINVNVAQVNNPGGVPSLEEQVANVDKVFDAEFTIMEEDDDHHGEEGVSDTSEETTETGGVDSEAAPEASAEEEADKRWDAIAEAGDPKDYSY